MKYLKILGLTLVAAAMMVVVGIGGASATELTCTEPVGTKSMCTAATIIQATTEGNAVLDFPLGKSECHSTFHGAISGTGSSSTTASTAITLTFTECNQTVTMLANGTLEVHTQETSANHNGTITSTGMEFTTEEFGFHCIYRTNSTIIGTLTGSSTTGGKARLDISATLPRTGGRSGGFCGSSAPMTGSYQIESPEWLEVD